MLNGDVWAGELGLLILIGAIALGFADIAGAAVAGQHREAPMDEWDAAHGPGTPGGQPPKHPLRHRVQRV